MKPRLPILAPMLGAIALISIPAAIEWPPKFIWNASASVPIGLYQVEPKDRLAVTDLVAVTPPEPIAQFLAERSYLPRGVPLLKRVLALPGQIVCRKHLADIVDGIVIATAREKDHLGRPLPTGRAAG